MSFSFFDLHCDSPTAMLDARERLSENSLSVNLRAAEAFDRYVQVMAIWTDRALDEEAGWLRLWEVLRYLRSDDAIQSGAARICSHCPDAKTATAFLLAVEDCRILNRKAHRLEQLFQAGFRILTPFWSGNTCMGGSHDTENGLSDFGRGAMKEALQMGMIPDLSHASIRSAHELMELADGEGKTVMASHSNAYEICPVSRNLQKTQIRDILSLKGVIGINFHVPFLSRRHTASQEDVLRHIEYFLELGCEDALCFGGDMDGAILPTDLSGLAAVPSLRDFLAGYYSEPILNKLFFENAYHFAERNLSATAKNL